jgi:predicted phage terminase large subunit-like protein
MTQNKTDETLLKLVISNFTVYKKYIWAKYEVAPHLNLLDNYLLSVLQYIETGGKVGISNLMVSMPPRHGKSQSISRLFPSYFLGRNPNKRVILASYGASLAEFHSRYVRAIIQTEKYKRLFPGVLLASDSRAKDDWAFAEPFDGGFTAVGVNGAVTGKGAHLLITDDPVKNQEQARSELIRNKTYDWFLSDLTSRQEPGSAFINVMTRWHRDDLNGRLLNDQGLIENGGIWTHLRLPAIALENDPLNRQVGSALWPKRYPINILDNIRGNATNPGVGEYIFNSLYQQDPISDNGGLFKLKNLSSDDHKILEVLPSNNQIIGSVRGWDLAMSESEHSDYTVGTLMHLLNTGAIVIANVTRFQKNWDELPNAIESVILSDGKQVKQLIEKVFIQSQIIRKIINKPALHNYVIKGIETNKDKVTRSLPFAARVGEGMVYIYKGAWNTSYIDELCSFPYGAHDDQVDSSSLAYYGLENFKNNITSNVFSYI